MYCQQKSKAVPINIIVVHSIIDVRSAESSLSCIGEVHDCSIAVRLCNICTYLQILCGCL